MHQCMLHAKSCNWWAYAADALNWLPADPAAEEFAYPVSIDVRELVSLEDVMDELQLGPNG